MIDHIMQEHNLTRKKALRVVELIQKHEIQTLRMMFPKQTTLLDFIPTHPEEGPDIEPWHTFRNKD